MGDQLSDHEERVRHLVAEVQNNPAGLLNTFDNLRAQAQSNTLFGTPSSSTPPPLPPAFDTQSLANAIAQAMAQAVPAMAQAMPQPQAFDMNALSNALAAGLRSSSASGSPPSRTRTPPRSEKLPDISEYEGDQDKLDAWEQTLIQRMHVNHDRYPTDGDKIAYAELKLAVGKKASNLMNRYRKDGLCTLTSFIDWRKKLREACGNPFEQEDARNYIRELKQGSMPFDEYFNLVSQKKERSRMEDASLIDAMKYNVNYTTQQASISWRKTDGQRPSTFDEYVRMYSEIDQELRQIKHRLPRQSTAPATVGQPPRRPNQASTPVARPSPATTPVTTAVPAVALPPGEPMDLDSARAAVRGKSTKIPAIKAICEKWRLCFYCKALGHSARACPAIPATSPTNLRYGTVTEIDDDQSVAGAVSLHAGKE